MGGAVFHEPGGTFPGHAKGEKRMKEYNDCFVQTSPVNGRAFSRLLVLLLSLVMALALVGVSTVSGPFRQQSGRLS